MSHVARIELDVRDLSALKEACRDMGLEFVAGQTTYKWFGRYMGDHPLPEGMTEADLGKCEHAIRVPGAAYEVGVRRKDNGFELLWDFWHSGGLERKLGKNGGRLKQAYGRRAVMREAKRKGYKVKETRTENGIRLELTGGRA